MFLFYPFLKETVLALSPVIQKEGKMESEASRDEHTRAQLIKIQLDDKTAFYI
jgi:hypothetical protein